MSKRPLPYDKATSGQAAYAEIEKILRAFGCSQFGVMNDWQNGAVIIQFEYRGRRISLSASWQGYASLWIKNNPYTSRTRGTREQHNEKARKRGEMAVPSILRDWIKGQCTAVECGLMPFEHAFMANMLLNDGTRLIDHAVKLLPKPSHEDKK